MFYRKTSPDKLTTSDSLITKSDKQPKPALVRIGLRENNYRLGFRSRPKSEAVTFGLPHLSPLNC